MQAEQRVRGARDAAEEALWSKLRTAKHHIASNWVQLTTNLLYLTPSDSSSEVQIVNELPL
mgnify:CR=1 FL=1